MPVRTRFAPSPTGYLHIGGVRTALFNWLFARQHGGQFLLRIDDTDAERNVAEALQPILDGFKWLGIDWDEGPPTTAAAAAGLRLVFSVAAARPLSGRSRKAARDGPRLSRFRHARRAESRARGGRKREAAFLYSRRWMAETDDEAERSSKPRGAQRVVRLKMPREGKCVFNDLIRGDCEFDWAKEQDHVIQRADGTCLYHLASVVDDYDFQITHVIRAVEHLRTRRGRFSSPSRSAIRCPNTPTCPTSPSRAARTSSSKRKIAQYLKNPEFKRLYDHGAEIAARIGPRRLAAETFNPVIVDFYREVGYLPDAIINYLMLLGWSLDDKTEDFSRDEMIKHFTLERVTKAPASFDPKKLWAFQDRYMQRLPLKQKVAKMLPFLQKAGLVRRSAALRSRSEADADRRSLPATG